ncbi:unnamed protein product [Closterium sp. NIES-53]
MVVYRPHTARAGRFSQRAQWGLHLGIERHYNAWKIFDVHSKETVAAHDVIFYERHTLQTYLDNLAANRDLTGGFHGNRAFASVADEADWDEQNMDGASEEAGPLPHCSVNIPMDDDNPRESVNAETYSDFADTGYVTPQPVDTNVSERIGPNFLPDPEAGDEAAYPEDANLPRYTQSGLQILGLVTAVHGAAPPKEPANIHKALGGEHKEKWHEAMDRELKALQERNTWKVGPIGVARNKTILTGKWVFRVKTKADGTIDKFKARWVVRGFDQERGQDFMETFAPVSRHTSLWILLAIAAMNRKKLRQIDVANAFLYAPVDAEIFVELPHGSNAGPNQVCQLEKSFYGIKQAPRLWQQHLHARLFRIGFIQLPHDQGMYRLTKGTDYILLIVYVDDLLYIGSTDEITTWFEGELHRDLTLTVATTGPAPSGVSQVDPLPGPALVQVAVDSGATRGAVSGGAEPAGAESEGAETGGAKPRGVAPGGAEPEGVEPGGAEPGGAALEGAETGASGAGGAGATGAGGTRVAAGVGVTRGTATTGPGGARTRGTGAAGTGGVGGAGVGVPMESGPGVGGTGAGGAGVVDPGGNVRPRPYFVPLLQQLLDTPPSASLTAPLLCPPPDQSQPPLQPASPLPAPSPYTEESGGLTERREPASCPVSPVRTARHVPRLRPPPLPGTHAMTLPPSSVPLRVPLPAPPESSLPEVADPESDRARTASPTFSRLLATAVTDPSFESTAAYALVAELLDFAAACRLDYATALVAESASASPPSVGGECALGIDVLEDMQEDFECLVAAVPRFASMLLALEGDPDAPDIPTPRSYSEAITGPYSSQWQAAMDVEMASWKSTGTYVDEVPPPGANIVNGMWIFRMKWPPGSPPAFKARYHSCMSAVYLHVYNC